VVGAALAHAGTPAEIHFLSGVNDKLERSLSEALVHHNVRSYTPAGPLLQQIRRHKSPSGIAMFQRAADISDAMFRSAMRATTAGLSEHHIFNVLEFEARLRGAERLAYPPVVAGGANGLSLHYINNNQLLRSGDLLLVDAGAEYHHYTSDVTRTWPVDGRFTPAQRIVYEAVLDVNERIIAAHTGATLSFGAIHNLSVRLLVEKLLDLRVLTGSVEGNMARGAYAPYYPHSIGHLMGWDIHEQEHQKLGPNMIVTVEPGLYLPDSDAVPKEFRGIAIRIEDNVVLTEGKPLVLTRNIPKNVADIEAAMSDGSTDPFTQYVRTHRQF